MTIVPLINNIKKLIKYTHVLNEENTKLFCVLPLFQYLGYDVFSPDEVAYEYGACLRQDKSERCDLVVLDNKKSVYMLVEIKSLGKDLSYHTGQIKQYFVAESSAKYAILTNGDEYWFYEEAQKMSIKEAEPVRKIKISNLEKEDLRYLNAFTRNVILPVFDIQDIDNAVVENINTKQIVLKEFAEKNNLTDAIQLYFDTISVDGLLGKDVNDVFYDYVSFCKNSDVVVGSKKNFIRRLKDYFSLRIQMKSKRGVLYNILVNEDYLELMEGEKLRKLGKMGKDNTIIQNNGGGILDSLFGKKGKNNAVIQNASVVAEENLVILDYIKAVRQDPDKWGAKPVAKKFHIDRWGNYKQYCKWCSFNHKKTVLNRAFWRNVTALSEFPENFIEVVNETKYDLIGGGKSRIFRIDPVVPLAEK
jgi:predicted type IV restriction endonuclease